MSDEAILEVARHVRDLLQGLSEDLFTPSDASDDDPPDGGVLTGFYLVCEWAGNDGKRWITYTRDPEQTQWQSRGLLLEAVEDL